MSPFETWWYNEGSCCRPVDEDIEEFAKRMCAIAWANGSYLKPVIGTKTWFEDGKVLSQNLCHSDVYPDPQAALARPEQEPVLQDIEQYRMQIAGICTAAIGYWKEGESIHPAYDTLALRDVAKLYAKYDALYKAPQRQPLTDEVLVPLNILEAAESSLGSFCSDHGWSDEDMQNMDNLSAYIAEYKAVHGIKSA